MSIVTRNARVLRDALKIRDGLQRELDEGVAFEARMMEDLV
jgi:hypothetical protein